MGSWMGRQERASPPAPPPEPAPAPAGGGQGVRTGGQGARTAEEGGLLPASDGDVLPGPELVVQTKTEQTRTIRCAGRVGS